MTALSREQKIGVGLLALAALLILLKPILPSFLDRLPIWHEIWAAYLDVGFDWLQNDLGLIHVTRAIAGWLGFLIDAAANILYGKSRWPRLEPIPWSVIAASGAVLGWYLGGWRLALLACGTCAYAALMGQWKWTMEMMSVIVVAAPFGFMIGLLLGIAAWKWKPVENALRPLLAVLQTLPFYTYLLPAVIFFKVGPTAAIVATIVYTIPPMTLMTNVGLKRVSPEVVEAGHMSGCTRWQMMRSVYIPSARTEILVGLNQVIMMCLAMVVLAAFIGMPGLGGKLLNMMNSFKLGRSLEIGVTIVLIAVTLDRLSKAWVVKQPEHFEKGTPWYVRHKFMVIGLITFAGMWLVSIAVQSIENVNTKDLTLGNLPQYILATLDEVSRKQSLSQGKLIDGWIKGFLAWDPVQAVTEFIRYIFNIWILIPTEKALLYVPTFGLIAAVTGGAWLLGGWRPAAVAGVFFALVAVIGWWDRAMLTLHSVITATVLAMLIGMPLAIAASRSAKGAKRAIFWCDTFQTFPSFVYLLPAIMLFGITPITVILSILIYTMVPVVRYTTEGLRGVPVEMTEAADMSGATRRQKLWKVQLPLAMPTIAVGLNQALMFSFFMVIIAAFIGTRDLGQEMQRTLAGTHLGKNFTLGFSVVLMALAFDIAINAWSERRRKALGL